MVEMSEQARQAKREYERKWRENNQDKIKVIRARYWEKRAERARCEGNAEATEAE